MDASDGGSVFRTEVLASFLFLEREFGFTTVDVQDAFVRYETTDGRFVNVYHGRFSFELKFEIGRHKSGIEEKYYPVDLSELGGASDEHFFQASTPERVRELVPRLATLLRTHGVEVLRGSDLAFRRLRDVQGRRSDELLLKWKLDDARQKAEEAWRAKDYELVARIYEPLVEHLTPSERKKLEYARNRR